MKTLLLFLAMLPLVAMTQTTKWYKITKEDWLIIGTQAIAGTADGVNQAIQFHKLGEGREFWDYKTSWQRKYRNWPTDQREAFPMSKTLLIGATDGYHLTRTIGRWANVATIVVSITDLKGLTKKQKIMLITKRALLSWCANRTAFTITYNLL